MGCCSSFFSSGLRFPTCNMRMWSLVIAQISSSNFSGLQPVSMGKRKWKKWEEGNWHPSPSPEECRDLTGPSLSPYLSPLSLCLKSGYMGLSLHLSLSLSLFLFHVRGCCAVPFTKSPRQALPGPLTAFRCVSGTVLQLQLRQAESVWPCDFWPRPVRLTSSSFSTPPPPPAGWPEASSILRPPLTGLVILLTQV